MGMTKADASEAPHWAVLAITGAVRDAEGCAVL